MCLPLHIGAISPHLSCCTLTLGDRNGVRNCGAAAWKPYQSRSSGVRKAKTAPARLDELVHTLDVTPDGVRLGSVRHQLKVQDELMVFYRQRRIQFRVVWTKKLEGTSEFQVGLKAVTHDSEASAEFLRVQTPIRFAVGGLKRRGITQERNNHELQLTQSLVG